MKLLIALYFFIFAIIQGGLLSGIIYYHLANLSVRAGQYWISSLFCSVAALISFGIGVLFVTDVTNPNFNFTVSNTLFYSAAVLQALFFSSLNKTVSKKLFSTVIASILVFFGVFEIMRSVGDYQSRSIFLASTTALLFLWQIIELKIKRKGNPSIALRLLQYLSVFSLGLNIYRIVFLFLLPITISHVSEVPQELILITVGQMVATTLAYIFIVAHWAERISIDNYRKRLENTEIRTLLEERELLVGSLLKANKTSATGALSASIAHELNQPLAATSLNIQLLQKKLDKGDLGPATQREVYATLLSDNERAASIIRSLKGIFSDQDASVESVSFPSLLSSIVTILNPELKSKEIELKLDIDSKLSMQGNPDELRQVMMNLIVNAIQALSESNISPKIITVKGRFTIEGIEIAVADNGIGIPAISQEALFELLTESKTKGMGLGLWLCKHIVTRHGGRIFYRKAKEGGAEFVMILPLISPL